MLHRGSKAKYIGETNGAFEKGKIYEVKGYDKELEAWGVMSDMDEIYAVAEEDLEEVE